MTEISAAMVKQLRDATSAGMMDCKRALQETEGDFDSAVALLREKGMAQAAKRAGRETSEGQVDVRIDGTVGSIVAVGCETEPVSKSDEFLAFVAKALEAVHADGEGAVEALEAERVDIAAKLGENIQVIGAKRMEAADGELLSSYIHPPGKVGALVRTKGGDPQVARSLALHLTFARPTYSTRDEVPAGARRRRARDPLARGRRALEARERAGEDRRGPAEQAVLRRVGAHRADVVPRRRVHRHGRSGAEGARHRTARLRLVLGLGVVAAAPQPSAPTAFRRIVLKLSGEALMGSQEYGIDANTIDLLARELVHVRADGLEVALVIGGGNIYRGMAATAEGMDRATGDYMGMLATVLNSLAVQEALERHGADTRVLSAIEVQEVAEPYIRRRAVRHLEKGRVVIFAAGTGNPFFTTDTAAALRALEIGAEAILMAKNGVEGVLDGDPRENPDAKLIPELTHLQAIERGLRVMDTTALSLCMDNHLPIHVFELVPGNIGRVANGERIGTIVTTSPEGDAR